MTTKKKSKSKPKAAPSIKIELSKRRKPGSKNATSFQPGNPYRFPENTSGNPGGVPKNHRLLSKTLRAMLSDPAPHALCRALGVPINSSNAFCIASRLVTMSALGDLEAVRLLAILTEGMNPRNGLALELDELQKNPDSVAPILRVCVVESDGDGRPKLGQSFDGVPFDLEQAVRGSLPAPQD